MPGRIIESFPSPSIQDDSSFETDSAVFNDGGDDIWPQDVENAFQEAYNLFPSTGRTKIKGSDGRLYGRNELISKYIYERTGKYRTRKQVSSHIQVLVKKFTRESGTTGSDYGAADLGHFMNTKTDTAPSLHTPRSSISGPSSTPSNEQRVMSPNQLLKEKISARKQFDMARGVLQNSKCDQQQQHVPPSSQDSNTSTTQRSQQRRGSLDMVLSAAIYLDRSMAIQMREQELLSKSMIRFREFEVVFNLHQSPVSAFVSCLLESCHRFQLHAVTQLFSYGQCLVEYNHQSSMNVYQDYDKWVYALDQKPLSRHLCQLADYIKHHGMQEAIKAVEGIHIRMFLKWSTAPNGGDVVKDDFYFTLQPQRDASGFTSLTFNYMPLPSSSSSN